MGDVSSGASLRRAGKLVVEIFPHLKYFLTGEQVGYRHCDADYHHPPAEINWWIPLTSVHNSNSLYTESTPGRGDFHPVTMEYGQALRFYGNLCCHYTVPNTTDSCRVSFDMRVLSLDHHS